ncbi:MAG: DUF3990 domain-containing protein [Oscillospiraceae bacterium]|nr:DUF3990 domain-containing protein [Oscillospiraceae bacterium]
MTYEYRFSDDCRLLREMRSLSRAELAEKLGIGIATVNRWENGQTEPTKDNLEKFYSYAYRNGVKLNSIKEQFYREELSRDSILLFHGAKTVIDGVIRPDASRPTNDFGKGFYMGESFRQAALFVSGFETSCVYCVEFQKKGLKAVQYSVDTEWMLTVACFRGRLRGRISEGQSARICAKANNADYIIAPIADNRMYQIIDSFIDGEITDEQCRHALAATELGMQFVLKTDKAVACANILERCFLCDPEKNDYARTRSDDIHAAEDKVRAARIRYRGKGKYIEELL